MNNKKQLNPFLMERTFVPCCQSQSFVFGKEIIHGHSPTVIVVILLYSIVRVQLTSNEFNLKAAEFTRWCTKKCEWRPDGGCLHVSGECAKQHIFVNTARFELSILDMTVSNTLHSNLRGFQAGFYVFVLFVGVSGFISRTTHSNWRFLCTLLN